MNLVKTSIYSSFSVVIRIITSFIVNKLMALYIGPAGLAVMGNFQNLLNIFSGLSTGSINSGVVKYTAEFGNEPIQLKALFSSAARVVTCTAAIVGGTAIIGSAYFSKRILHDASLSFVFILFGLTVILYSFNIIFLSILNGKKEIRKFTITNILSSLTSLLITASLIYYKQLTGALLSLVIAQSCFFFISFYFLNKCEWFSVSMFFGKAEHGVIKNLFRFSAMGITSAIMVPLSSILIRNLITKEVSADSAGYWEAITRVSANYLMLVTTSLSIYYLPKLSETHNDTEIRSEISKGYKLIMPVIILASASIYLFRFFIIHLLFSHQFGGMEPLFMFQLIGDVIKIASWLLAFLMLAKAMARLFIITEIIFNLSYVLLSYIFVHQYGLVGVTYAYALNYTLYLFTCYFLLRKRFGL